MSIPGFRIKLHQSLIMPIMLAGVPRRFAILNGTIAAAIVFGLHAYFALPLFILLHIIAVIMAKHDPSFFDIFLRSLKQRNYYDV